MPDFLHNAVPMQKNEQEFWERIAPSIGLDLSTVTAFLPSHEAPPIYSPRLKDLITALRTGEMSERMKADIAFDNQLDQEGLSSEKKQERWQERLHQERQNEEQALREEKERLRLDRESKKIGHRIVNFALKPIRGDR